MSSVSQVQQDQQYIDSILQNYTAQIKAIYREHLKKVILYGSYARGDFTDGSDIDIMILVDLDDEGIKNAREKLVDITYEVSYNYNIDIMPIVKNQAFFERWLKAYPFYGVVKDEGVELYAA